MVDLILINRVFSGLFSIVLVMQKN